MFRFIPALILVFRCLQPDDERVVSVENACNQLVDSEHATSAKEKDNHDFLCTQEKRSSSSTVVLTCAP